jgi:hypothetical protein
MPVFGQLSPQGRQELLDRMVFRPPELENKQFQQQVMEVTEKARQGDEEAKNLIDRTLWQDTMAKTSLIYNVVDHQIVDPLMRKSGAEYDGPSVAGLQAHDLSKREPDQEKALEYFRMLRDENTAWAKKQGTIETVSAIGGALAEFGALFAFGAGTTTVPRGLAKLTVGATRNAVNNRIISEATRRGFELLAAPALHASTTAAMGVVHQKTLDMVNRAVDEDQTFREAMAENAAIFGEYALYDLVANLALDVALPHLKGVSKVFTGKLGEAGDLYNKIDPDKAIERFIANPKPDMTLLKQLPRKTREQAAAFYRSKATLANIKQAPPEDLLNLVANHHNYYVTKVNEKNFIVGNSAKGVRKNFDSFDKARKFLNEELISLEPTKLSTAEAATRGAAYDSALIRETVEGQVKNLDTGNPDLVANAFAPKKGQFNPDGIRNISKALLRQNGADDSLIRATKITNRTSDSFTLNIAGRENVTFPVLAKKASDETEPIRDALRKIGKVTEDLEGRNYITDDLVKTYTERIGAQDLMTPSWLQHNVKKNLNGEFRRLSNDNYEIRLPSNQRIQFENLQDAGRYVIQNTVDEDFLRRYLSRYQGSQLSRAKNGEYTVKRGKHIIAKGRTLEELMNQNPQLVEHLPSTLGPEITLISPQGKGRVEMIGNVAYGPYDHVMRNINSFRDPSTLETVLQNKGGTRLSMKRKNATQRFEVDIPELGYHSAPMDFKSAKAMINKGWDDWGNMRKAAFDKGYRLETAGTKFALYGEDGQEILLDSKEQLAKELQNVPVPPWAPELVMKDLDVMENVVTSIPEHNLKGARFTEITDSDGILKRLSKSSQEIRRMSYFWRPPEGYLDDMVRRGGDQKIADYYRDIEKTLQWVAGQEYTAAKTARSAFIKPSDGKMLSKTRRRALRDWIIEDDPEVKKQIHADRGITRDEEVIAERVRRIYGETPEEGLAQKFGVRPQDFIESYLPKIKKEVLRNPDLKHLPDAEVRTFFEQIYGTGSVPRELDAFFKHHRVSDIVDMSLEDDILLQIDKYIFAGHRQQFLGPLWEEADDYIKALKQSGNANEITAQMVTRFQNYRSDIMGIGQGLQMREHKYNLGNLLRKFGVDTKKADKLIDVAMSWGYMSAMGFRPWLAMRNVMQPWHTTALQVGNDHVARAVKEIIDDVDGEIFDMLRQRGVIRSTLPITESSLGSMDSGGFQKAMRSGLRWYRNSDDWNRAVAYVAARNRWDDGAKKLRNPQDALTTQKFWDDYSTVNFLPPGRQRQIREAFDQGQDDIARDIFSTEVVENTQFRYRAGQKPEMFRRGIVGKMFGMFGTYPVQYVERMNQMLTNLSPAQKAVVGASLTANTAALYFTYQETLGVNADAFLPWTQMTFAGGPYYSMLHTALQAFGNPSYKGRQARAELLGIKSSGGTLRWEPGQSEMAQWVMPFGFAFNDLKAAARDFNEGNHYKAFLNATSAPVDLDYFKK